MRILAIDTAADLCAACVFDSRSDATAGRKVLDLGRGHAESVMGVIEAALEAAGLGYGGLGAIAVSVGPGSFTGVRVGVSAARGLALALSIPAIGVSTLEALAAEARRAVPDRPVLVALGQRSAALFAAAFDAGGEALIAPAALPAAALAAWALETRAIVAGSAAPLVAAAAATELPAILPAATADIATYARLAAARRPGGERPRPLYLRAPDAAPQTRFALPRREA